MLQSLEKGGDPRRIGDLRARPAIGHIEGVDRRAFLGADARESDRNVFFTESREQFVEQPKAIGRLNLHDRESRMGFVFDRNPRGKVEAVSAVPRDSPPRLFQQRSEIEMRIG